MLILAISMVVFVLALGMLAYGETPKRRHQQASDQLRAFFLFLVGAVLLILAISQA